MKKLFHTPWTALSLGIALASPAFAQDHSAHAGHAATTNAAAAAPTGQTEVLTAGEITRVDGRTGKLTIRHEEIKNLDMPPMTMVFALSDSAQSASFKPGDKVRFRAEDRDGTLIITRIQPAS
ncbi:MULTISPECIES: copper-binding protein [Comamonas]|uniref:copper-binding protein n=1 Tax=Comamonas TaxID=283 RepID=UPI0012CCEC5C|nr:MULTISPECIES: copper-binding protein [Comamonas]MEB5964571.1 copper-binding protein [Comamonas testosteroni]MPS93220.1 copper-binding protein [Comamonas sp.]